MRATLDEQENAILDAIKNDCLTVSSSIDERRFRGAFRLEYMFCAGSYPVVFAVHRRYSIPAFKVGSSFLRISVVYYIPQS